MRSTTKLMKNWQFTGPDGKTTAVDLHLHLQDAVCGARF